MLSLLDTSGLYFHGYSHQKRQILVDDVAARRAAMHLTGITPALDILMERRWLAQGREGPQHAEMIVFYARRSSGIQKYKGRPRREVIPSTARKDSYPRCIMCVVGIPWSDRQTGKLDPGRACQGCAQEQQCCRYGSRETTADSKDLFRDRLR